MSHEIGFSGKICFYTNLICHAKFSFTQLIFQHKVFSAKFGSGFNFKQIFSAIFSLIFLRKNRSEAFCVSSEKYIAVNVPALCEVASFVTEYFRLLLNFLRKINVNLPQNSQSRKTCVGGRLFIKFHYSILVIFHKFPNVCAKFCFQ